MFHVQVLAAHRAQAFAVVAAQDAQRNAEQNLLAQRVFKQKTFALIVADFGFGPGYCNFLLAGIDPKGPVKQVKLAFDILDDRFKAASRSWKGVVFTMTNS